MSTKKLFILIFVLIGLAVLSIAKKNYEHHNQVLRSKDENKLVALNPGLSIGFIDEIILQNKLDEAQTLEVNKNENGEWLLRRPFDARVRKESMDSFLKELAAVKGDPRASTKNVWDDFKIGDHEGIHVSVNAAGKSLGHWVISPLRPGGTINFIRSMENANLVISTNTDLLALLGIFTKDSKFEPRIFTDLRIMSFDAGKVSQIHIDTGQGSPFGLVKAKEERESIAAWSFDPPDASAEIDRAKVDSFLSALNNLYASEALDSKKQENSVSEASPFIRCQYEKNGKPVETSIFLSAQSAETKKYHLKIMPEGYIYSMSETSINNLKKDKAYFLKEKTGSKKT